MSLKSSERWCSLVLLAVFISLFLYYVVPGFAWRSDGALLRDEPERVDAAPAANLQQEQAAFFARASQRVRPAVIRIDAVHLPAGADEDPRSGPPENAGSIYVSRGCGLIVDPHGLAVTSCRLVEGAGLVRLYLARQNSAVSAEVAGSDRRTDLALLRFPPPANLPVVSLGEDNRLAAGECVMVLGNGYVPGEFICVGRALFPGRPVLPASLSRDDCIRTPAANLWNCGGPLVNLQGQVVGLATSLEEFDAEPAGLAVTGFTLRRVIEELRSHSRVHRGWLGVFVHQADLVAEDSSARLAMAVDYVVPGSPAQKAGIRAGDLIVRFDGAPFESPSEFRRRIVESPLGAKVGVTILLQNSVRDVRVTIDAAPAVPPTLPGEREWGIRLSSPSEEETKFLGLEEAQGVVVQDVLPGRLASQLSRRDVILSVNNAPTPTLEDFCREVTRLFESPPASTVSLEILSDGTRRTIGIESAR